MSASFALPASPTAEDIFLARIFEEPLVPMGADPTLQENADFATALVSYAKCDGPDDFSALTSFLDAHPHSTWNGALLTNLGLVYYRRGHYSRALQAWSSACSIAMTVTNPAQKPLADRAIGELAYMLARIGRVSELGALLRSVEHRAFCGPATEKIAGARAGLAEMLCRPEVSFRCGPLALHRIMLAVHPEDPRTELIAASESTRRGFSLNQLEDLSRQLGLDYRTAFRQPGADLVVPSVVHFTVDHFAAVIRCEGDRYLLEDPTFKNDAWVTREALDTEASGYFLVPYGELPPDWRDVKSAEAGQVWGAGNVPNPPDPPGPCDPNTDPCDTCPDGMATPRIYLLDVSLSLTDSPAGYSPPVGPAVPFTVRYRQRDNQFSSTFNYSNFGPKWTFDWLAYIIDDPTTSQADVTYYMRGGGNRTFTGFDTTTQAFAYQVLDQTLLTRTSASTYEMLAPDGTLTVFGQSDGGVTTRRIFLSQVVHPAGNAVILTYDADLRVTAITDAIGQQTTLAYGNTADTFKITAVTDPFGRSAAFGYNTAGQLTSITDTLGLVSAFTYDPTTTDLVTTLTTPYGVTQFTNAESGTTRSMEILYPDGNRERAEFNQSTTLGIAGSDPPDSVPSGMATTNEYLYYRNTYFWDKQGCAYAYGDYTRARIYHWLHSTDLQSPVGILESTKAPLEGRVWYDYVGQTTANGSIVVGTTSKPTHTGRVLDDGSTRLSYREYDDFGNITTAVDPAGRTFSYTYDAAYGIDLLETRQTRAGQSELMRQTTYNNQHQPLTSSDAAGQMTTFTYNTKGQVKAVTDPLDNTTTYQYDANGYRTSLTGPLGATDTTTWTYDAFGRIHTITDNSGCTLTYGYDAADRITTIAYPDTTFQQFTYTLLVETMLTDRAGRQTTFEYNNVRQMIKRTDPLGRVTLFEWCKCGALRRLADPMGRTTTWRHDIQGRVTCKEYADGSQVTYLYEDTTSRLRQRIDETLQVTQYNYNRDDTLSRISYTNATVTTAPVAFAYDANYNRVTSMTDGTGTTRYGYVPITPQPELGAGLLATVNGSLPGATITYGYDELDRQISDGIDGTGSSVALDAAGRVTSETNALGTFTYTYDGDSFRETSQTCPNGQTTQLSYGGSLLDNSLQQITNQNGPTPISEFLYGYDTPLGLITSWSQQSDAQAPFVYSLGYGAADQLTSAAVSPATATTQATGYTYDPADNRLSEQIGTTTTNLSYNALNELTASGTPDAAATHYQWDAEHRLVNTTSGNQSTQLTYDGYGRCAGILQSAGGTETSNRLFLWAGHQIREERAPDGTVSKRFFRQGVTLETGATAGAYFYTRDHLGSIRELTDSTGSIRARYSYDPFGRPTHLTGDLDTDFGYAGMFYPAELGLNMTKFRLYDPDIGRWLSRDPLINAEARQGPSLYVYVRNDPINRTDPLGLETFRQFVTRLAFKAWEWGTTGPEDPPDPPDPTPMSDLGARGGASSGPAGGPPDAGPPDGDDDGGAPPGGATGPEGTGACCDPGSGSGTGSGTGSDSRTVAGLVAAAAAGGILGLTWPQVVTLCGLAAF
jgi:RHS repeat-associated protein